MQLMIFWDFFLSFRFPQASASYILLQFAQYGNILKHVVCLSLKLTSESILARSLEG